MTALEFAQTGLASAKTVLGFATLRAKHAEAAHREAVDDEAKAKEQVVVLEELVRLASEPRPQKHWHD